MTFLTSIPEMDLGIDIGPCDLLPANSPPPLDPGADDEMDEVDDVEDPLFDFKVVTPNDTRTLAFWDLGKLAGDSDPHQTQKDNIAIVQELPPSLEGKRLFGDSINSEFNPVLSNNSPLPWDAFVQSHIQFNSDKLPELQRSSNATSTQTATQSVPSESSDSFLLSSADDFLDLSLISGGAIVSNSSIDPLTSTEFTSDSTSYFDFSNQDLPTIKKEDTITPSSELPETNTLKRNSSSSSDNMSTTMEPARTEEERKRRNRVYAKRSRDLKNQKYKETLDINKDLQQQLKLLQEENQELKLQNQQLSYQVKEFLHKFQSIEKDLGIARLQLGFNQSSSSTQKLAFVKDE